MTLTITIVSDQGLWQASDHRLTSACGLEDDASLKHVRVGAKDGKALIAYAGLGRVGDTHISEWIRRVLRSANRPIEYHLSVLREAANKKLQPICQRENVAHTFSVAAFKDDQPVWYGITNRIARTGERQIGGGFVFLVGKPENYTSRILVKAEGSGAYCLPADEVTKMIKRVIKRRADKASLEADLGAMLAELIRQASDTPQNWDTVSPHCIVSYLKGPKEVFQSTFHGWDPQAKRPIMQDWSAPHQVGRL